MSNRKITAKKIWINAFHKNNNEIWLHFIKNNTSITYNDGLKLIYIFISIFHKTLNIKNNIFILNSSNDLDYFLLYSVAILFDKTIIPCNQSLTASEKKLLEKLFPDSIWITNNPKCKNEYKINFDCKKIDLTISNIETTFYTDYHFEEINNNETNGMLITFTSGTTGKRRGIIHKLSSLVLNAYHFYDFFTPTLHIKSLHFFSKDYMAGILNSFMIPTISSGSIFILQNREIISLVFWDLLKKFNINYIWTNPTLIKVLTKNSNPDFDKINRKIIIYSATAPLYLNLKKDFENKFNIKVYQSYGLTETLLLSSNSEKFGDISDSVGKILPTVNVKFGKSYSENDGEILIKSQYNYVGYIDLQKQSINLNSSDYISTGDVGILIDNNFLKITGRIKDIIIKKGFNLSSSSIEQICDKNQFIKESAAIGISDDLVGEKLILILVLNHPMTKSSLLTFEKSLQNEIICELGVNYKIDEFIYIKNLPRNKTGKVIKFQLSSMYNSNSFK